MKFFCILMIVLINLLVTNGCRPRPRVGIFGRMEGNKMDYKIEKAAFALCGNEDDYALTWDEVVLCEVCNVLIKLFITRSD